MAHAYLVNDTWLSLQGEGARAGTVNVFVRFAGCNQTCQMSSHMFDCDTEFVSHRKMTAAEILARANALWPDRSKALPAMILTGGEPLLQVDKDLILALSGDGWYLALETNGSLPVPPGLDWVCCSPKVAEHALRVEKADELKYVRNAGQGIPVPKVPATHYYISPASKGDEIDRESLKHCIKLVLENPKWRLTTQAHKTWSVR